uniref:Ig-like domain-containing protein n=1 Tax=Anser brachyrhynchus TaxID=132585 RepID=A0A8B9BWU0_9AVES
QTPGEVSQREGSDLSVLCPYPAEVDDQELKSWCRGTDQGCQHQVVLIGTRMYPYTDRARQGHVTIQDDPIHRNFSITMTDLQVEDSGTYFCAYSHSNVPLKRISLNVFKGEYLIPMQTPVLSGGNVTAAPLHSPPARNLCQGAFLPALTALLPCPGLGSWSRAPLQLLASPSHLSILLLLRLLPMAPEDTGHSLGSSSVLAVTARPELHPW